MNGDEPVKKNKPEIKREIQIDDTTTVIQKETVEAERVKMLVEAELRRREENRKPPLMPYRPVDPPNPPNGKPAGAMGAGSPMYLFIIIAVIAAVMAYGVQTFFGTPKSNYKDDITRLEMDIVDVRTTNTNQATGITELQDAKTTANTAKSTAEAASNKVTSLEEQLVVVDDKLATAETDLYGWLIDELPVLQEQVDALATVSNFDATYLENDIATVQTDVETVGLSLLEQTALVDTIRAELTVVQGLLNGTGEPVDLTAIENRLILLEADIAGVGTELIAIQAQLDSFNASVVVLTERVTALEAITQSYILVEPNLSSLYVNLYLTSGLERVVSFQITAIPTGNVVLGSGSYNDTLTALYDTPPLTMSALGTMVPSYEIGWWDGEWHLVSTTFHTPATVVAQGESGKSLTYSGTYNFRVLIDALEVAEYETGGVW